jgi:hypothetical protein
VQVLTDAGIEYMLTGSMASSLQGEPRSTHDIDLVVDLESAQALELTKAFPMPEFYLSESAIAEAVRQRRMFNLLEISTGEKVDFWLLTDEPFDRSSFERRQWDDVDGLPIQVSSPEDTILGKLRWSQLSGGSERQFNDALHVYEVQHGGLDLDYLNSWADRLNVRSLWERLKSEAKPPQAT